MFKIKHNGVYQMHLVACGYSQLPGIFFPQNYCPLVDNIMFCILLVMVIHFENLAKIVNVETTFLYGEFEEEIYM